MISWSFFYTMQAQKDAKKIAAAGLKDKVLQLLEILKIDPYQNPPPFENLVGNLSSAYSRRINIQHRLIYEVLNHDKQIKVLLLCTHYE